MSSKLSLHLWHFESPWRDFVSIQLVVLHHTCPTQRWHIKSKERAQMGKIWNANFCTQKKIQERNITKLLRVQKVAGPGTWSALSPSCVQVWRHHQIQIQYPNKFGGDDQDWGKCQGVRWDCLQIAKGAYNWGPTVGLVHGCPWKDALACTLRKIINLSASVDIVLVDWSRAPHLPCWLRILLGALPISKFQELQLETRTHHDAQLRSLHTIL